MRTREDRSVGIVVFRGRPRKYLLLFKFGRTDYPKGHVEQGETDEQAAKRELKEEAGITSVEIIPGFKQETQYQFVRERTRIKKTVPHFLGRTSQRNVRVSKEHEGYVWVTFSDAMRLLSFKNQRDLMKKAEEFLNGRHRS